MSEALIAALKNVRGGRVTMCTTEMLDRPERDWVSGAADSDSRMADGAVDCGRAGADCAARERSICAAAMTGRTWRRSLALVAFPLNPALSVDGASALPRARDGVRRGRGANYECSAGICSLPGEPCGAWTGAASRGVVVGCVAAAVGAGASGAWNSAAEARAEQGCSGRAAGCDGMRTGGRIRGDDAVRRNW